MDERVVGRIVLASTSPRRRKLLERAGYTFEVAAPAVDEETFPQTAETPAQHAEALALAKARSVASRYRRSIVISADTVVDFQGQIIGKPRDVREAETITRKLFSRPHRVITGLALIRLHDGREVVGSDVTTVYPREMTEAQIARHLAGGRWVGKAHPRNADMA